MSVVIYFGMMIMVIIAGFGILGVTFRHWYIEAQKKKQQQ